MQPDNHAMQMVETTKAINNWIDELDEHNQNVFSDYGMLNNDVAMRLLAQQGLPRNNILTFDGSPEKWIEFMVQFNEMVHQQQYLTVVQKKSYLIQHVQGEPKKAFQGFGNNWYGYVKYSVLNICLV